MFRKKQESSNNTLEVPKHIAIIMDGNGRWAKEQKKPRKEGHKAGIKTLQEILETCSKLNIGYLSVYAFSTENWNRPKAEVSFLMTLFESTIESKLKDLVKNNIKVKIIGNKSQLSETLQKKITHIEEQTKNNTNVQLNLMINYGSREEIVSTCKNLLTNPAITAETLTEDLFSQHLYTKNIPDPELLIRTSGEQRISNFLLWQLSYSELFFSDKLWPEFNGDDLSEIIHAYQHRQRRFGGL